MGLALKSRGPVMQATRPTRWILALLMLTVGAQALASVPIFPYSAIVLWGLSLTFLIVALVLAVRRARASRRPTAP